MRRVAVVGNAGSGKSKLAARLSARLGVPHVELDAIFHLAGWRELPDDDFRAEVLARVAADGWVVDGNYGAVRDIVWASADTVVWLDYPRHLVMRRVIARTFGRVLFRRTLWNGNRERLREVMSTDPERSIVAWSWKNHHRYRVEFAAVMKEPRWSHLRFLRITSPRAAARLVR